MPRQTGLERVKEFGPARPYVDPSLRNPKLYKRVLRQFEAAGLVEYRLRCEAPVGLFFVYKKDGSLRVILDGRCASHHFDAPPVVELATGSSFAQISVDSDGPISLAGVDIVNAFYCIQAPSWLRGYFGLPRVRAGQMGVEHTVCGTAVDPGAWVVPCFRAMPMGGSFSLWMRRPSWRS